MTGEKRFYIYICLAQFLVNTGCVGNPPTSLGQFAPCPSSPNCVSTQSADEEHAIGPISYSGIKDSAKKRLVKIIGSLPRTRVVVDNEDYLHVEFTSRVFRFVDDVEFYLGVEDAMIHFRSASRLGHSDLGANRKRMETIRARFIASAPAINNNP